MATWTKTQLLADLASVYLSVGEPVQQEDINGVKTYLVNVVETGASEKSEKPLGYKKNIVFYVYHEGLGDENAMYSSDEPIVSVARSVVGTGLSNIASCFNSQSIRNRVISGLCKSYRKIVAESGSTTDHAIRLKLANLILQNPAAYVNAFMAIISTSPTAQSSGGAITDGQLESLIDLNVADVATAFGLVP